MKNDLTNDLKQYLPSMPRKENKMKASLRHFDSFLLLEVVM